MTSQQTPDKRLEIVEFLKGFAIFTIVVMHYLMPLSLPGPVRTVLPAGGAGVHLFIVLSGFGLYLSQLRRPSTAGQFLGRRFSRVYLPYLVTVTAIAAVSAVTQLYAGSWSAFLGHVFLFKMFDESIVGSYGYHLWFLSTIFQLYLAFPFLVNVKSRVSDAVFLALGITVSLGWILVVYCSGHGETRIWNSFFLGYLWEFNAGMLLAQYAMAKPSAADSIPSVALIAAAIIGGASYGALATGLGGLGKLINDFPGVIGYGAVGLLAFRFSPGPVRRFFVLTGLASYPLYLIHMFVFDVAATLASAYGVALGIPLVALIFAAAWLFARLLQRPFAKLGARATGA
jgi:peptidoglycan/LPS O-acetylase OafA/YrhL